MKIPAAARERWGQMAEPTFFIIRVTEDNLQRKQCCYCCTNFQMNNYDENHPKPCLATFCKSPQVSSLKSAVYPVSNAPFHSELHLHANSVSESQKGLGQGWGWPKHLSLLKVAAYAVAPCIYSPSTQQCCSISLTFVQDLNPPWQTPVQAGGWTGNTWIPLQLELSCGSVSDPTGEMLHWSQAGFEIGTFTWCSLNVKLGGYQYLEWPVLSGLVGKMKGSCPEGEWREMATQFSVWKGWRDEAGSPGSHQACRSWEQSWAIWSLKCTSVFLLIHTENQTSCRSTSSLACLWQDKLLSEARKIQQWFAAELVKDWVCYLLVTLFNIF